MYCSQSTANIVLLYAYQVSVYSTTELNSTKYRHHTDRISPNVNTRPSANLKANPNSVDEAGGAIYRHRYRWVYRMLLAHNYAVYVISLRYTHTQPILWL